jgi:hypothetical protein
MLHVKHETALEAAFKSADRMFANKSRLWNTAVDFLRRVGDRPQDMRARLFLDVLRAEDEMLETLAADYLERTAADIAGKSLPGEGQTKHGYPRGAAPTRQTIEGDESHPANDTQEKVTQSPSTGHDRTGHITCETQHADARPVVRLGYAKRGGAVLAAVNATMAKSLFDTVTTRDGRPLRKVQVHELRKFAREDERSARVWRYLDTTIHQHSANPG